MKDIQNYINNILSKIKVANVSEDESTSASEYSTEPILKTARELINTLPYKYREMRKIKLAYNDVYYDRTAKLFYEQGKFMEYFEDYFEYSGDYSQYYPTYYSMNDNQLRGYFSWRTKLREGNIEKTCLSFVFVYVYELLNNIGVSSPLDGYERLMKFGEAYIEYEPKIKQYLNLWMKDYIIYYNLDTKLLAVHKSDDSKQLEIIYDFKSCTPKELTEALSYYSNYNLLKSKFYIQYPNDVAEVVYKVYSELTEYYEKNRKNSIFIKFFGNKSTSPYYLFSNAVFYRSIKSSDREVRLSICDNYILKNGNWQRDNYPLAKKKNKTIGEILKLIDSTMRISFNFPYPLTLSEYSQIYYKVINKAVQNYCIENEKIDMQLSISKKYKKKTVEVLPEPAPAPVIIDTLKFEVIRAASDTIQNRLIVESEPIIPIIAEPTVIENKVLNQIEVQIVKAIFENDERKVNDILKAKGLMLSVIIDDINEKLFDEFNDNCIEICDDKPQIIDDYANDLKGIINI